MATVGPVLVAAAPLAGPGEAAVSSSLARRLGLSPGELQVTAGPAQAAAASVVVIDQPSAETPTVRLHPALLHQLRIPDGTRLHARWQEATRTLALGPFVGILALRSRRSVRYGEHEPFFQGLTRVGSRLGIAAYVFGPPDVDWSRRQVYGYTAVGAGPARRWRRTVYPLPDVVYDRVQTRRAELRPEFAAFRERLSRSVSGWFNRTGFFDKWRMHVELSKNERLRRYLPETALYNGQPDLERFLAAHKTVYLKPVGGSLGLGIIRVQRTPAGFVAARQPGETLLTHRATSVRALAHVVARLTRSGQYIIQQGLPLARWDRRPFDVRVLMQRTSGGTWALTKMYSRIAAPGRFTANLTRGGQGCRIGLLLRRVYGRRHKVLLRALREAGFEIAREVERTVPGTVGELGLDIGLDRRGRIWLIEVNSKPFLQMTREAGSARTLSLSVQRPLRFAKFLAGFDEERSAHAPSSARHLDDVS